jgi:large subunit ribosomal protein L9
MKVVFLEDVEGVAHGGDIKVVKSGFARNYLIPKALAVPATHDAMQRIEKLTQNAEKARLKTIKDMTALGEELAGTRIDIEMRAGTGGRLYGSVTNAIVATKLSELTGREIDRRSITVPDSVRELGVYTASIRLHTDIEAEIGILVHPLGTDAAEYLAELEAADAEPAPEGEGESGTAEKAEVSTEASTEATAEADESSAKADKLAKAVVEADKPAESDEAVAEADEPAEATAEADTAEEASAEAVAEADKPDEADTTTES